MNRSWKPALCLLAVCGALSLVAAPAGAEEPWTLLSPWTLSRSGYFVQGTFSYLNTGSFYDGIGEKVDNPDGNYRDMTLGTHVEYGLRDRMGLMFHIPIRWLRQEYADTPDLTTSGIGDFTGGLRYKLYDGSFVASAQGEIKLSSGYNASVTEPALGAGQTDYTIRALVGRSLAPKPVFGQAAFGFRGRNQAPANQLLLNLDAGMWPAEKVLVTAHWEWVSHTGEGEIEEYFKGGLAARARVRKAVDATLGVFHTFGGMNVPSGTQVFVGVSYKGSLLGKYDGMLTSSMDASGEPLPETVPGPPPAIGEPEAAPEEPEAPAAPATP